MAYSDTQQLTNPRSDLPTKGASTVTVNTTTPPAAATTTASVSDFPTIDLRDRWLAAFLAWLIPGAGHIYQRRYGKGFLFMVCILGTFFYGIFLGSSNVVYASFRKADGQRYAQDDARYAFLCQIGAGLPALPALVQARRVGGTNPKAPLWDGFMAPPVLVGQRVHEDWYRRLLDTQPHEAERFKAEDFGRAGDAHWRYFPNRPSERGTDYNGWMNQLSMWHQHYGSMYDLGTVFTMIAGLLNVLVVFDAWGGPMGPDQRPEPKKEPKKSDA
jgi:hypothetical protein